MKIILSFLNEIYKPLIAIGVLIMVIYKPIVYFYTSSNLIPSEIEEIKKDIKELKTEVREDIKELKTEVREDIKELKTELTSEFKEDIEDLKKILIQKKISKN